VDADQPLKRFLQVWPRRLLGLLGEREAVVVSAGVIELPVSRRSVDVVIRLRRGHDTYLRHVEFEMRYRRGLELRLFEYAARLQAQFRLPVVTTVVFLRSPAPAHLSHREVIDGQVVHQRRFDVLRLWDQDPEQLLAMGPGPAALVGRARGSSAEHVRAAAQLICRSTSAAERSDLLYVLQALCAERYTAKDLERMIPREGAMASGMFAKEFRQARAEGRAQGRAEGRAQGRAEGKAEGLAEAVSTCLEIVRHIHPTAIGRVAAAVEGCQSLPTIRKWTVAAAQLPAAEFIRLISGSTTHGKAAVSRRRAPRPSRRSSRRSR
jgi:predicted transposase YdaD